MKLEPCNNIINNLIKSKNFSLRKFNRKIPNSNISDNLTYLDVMAFHQYVDSKRMNSNIDIIGLQKLYKKRGHDFFTGAITYFMDIYKYPSGLRPKIGYNTKMEAPMGFVPNNNTIYINKNEIADWSAEKCLVTLRHEFRHFEQFVDVLRSTRVRFKNVDFYATQNMAEERFNELYKAHKLNKPDEKFDALSTYWDCLIYYEKHPNDKELQAQRKRFGKYRYIATSKLGWIMFDTEESKRAERIFAEHKMQNLNPSGLVGDNFVRYHTSYAEYDAYLAQKLFENQITADKKCLFSTLKQSNQSILKMCTSDKGLCSYLSRELKSWLKTAEEKVIYFLNND